MDDGPDPILRILFPSGGEWSTAQPIMPALDTLWALWGKANPKNSQDPSTHPLLCHLMDVGSVALAMLDNRLPFSTVQSLVRPIGLPHEHALPWLGFLVALHDLGKATPAFQAKFPPKQSELHALGLPFPQYLNDKPHGTLGISEIARILSKRLKIETPIARRTARAVCAHHGEFPTFKESLRDNLSEEDLGEEPWDQCRELLVDQLIQWLELDQRPAPQLNITHAWIVLLAGLSSVADWIGSMEDIFAYSPRPSSLEAYAAQAKTRADQALQHIHWHPPPPPKARQDFAQLFPSLPNPWPLHLRTQELLPSLQKPALIIIEAPMGEGKTEAALMIADALSAQVGHHGFYLGLPTQATSNAMLTRMEQFLGDAYADHRQNLQLIHGDAALQKDYRRLKLSAIYGSNKHSIAPDIVAEEWFCRKKRALLAEYAVGTIDQALLSAMQVRHGFVRLFGLAGKTIVLDEVHAYDTYTSVLINQLLEWLSALGTSVILLSATLPSHKRREFLKAYGAGEPISQESAYPRITVAQAHQQQTLPVPCRKPPVRIQLEQYSGDEQTQIAQRLLDTLEQGGCAAWICNTIARAQETYSLLKELSRDLPNPPKLQLIHSRMLYGDRQKREQEALSDFGKDESKRPEKAILVGTQVLEQSLDVDFDLMISDIAPIDLLFQRAGRLHRHARQTPRPQALSHPRFWLLFPPGGQRKDGPGFQQIAGVYEEELVMLRTWLILQGQTHWTLPLDIEPSIERVYALELCSDELNHLSEAFKERLRNSYDKHQKEMHAHKSKAQMRLLPTPTDTDDFFGKLGTAFDDEEDKDIHESLKALTRLGEPSTEILCLYGSPSRPTLDPEGQTPIDLNTEPNPKLLAQLLQNSLKISHKGIAKALQDEPLPKAFQRSPSLARRHILYFGNPPVLQRNNHELILDAELGLIIKSARA